MQVVFSEFHTGNQLHVGDNSSSCELVKENNEQKIQSSVAADLGYFSPWDGRRHVDLDAS